GADGGGKPRRSGASHTRARRAPGCERTVLRASSNYRGRSPRGSTTNGQAALRSALGVWYTPAESAARTADGTRPPTTGAPPLSGTNEAVRVLGPSHRPPSPPTLDSRGPHG